MNGGPVGWGTMRAMFRPVGDLGQVDHGHEPDIVIDLRALESDDSVAKDPDRVVEDAAGLRWEGATLVGVQGRHRAYWWAKRALDIGLVVLAAPVVVTVVAVLALAIKLDSPGPALYRQERIGAKRVVDAGGRTCWRIRRFTFLKLRTMFTDADAVLHQSYMAAYIAGDEEQMRQLRDGVEGTYKMENDPRITRVGRVLRRLSLDELPQLWNVLRGDMSLVGPRPPIPYEVEKYEAPHFRRLASMPGITGWWQVNGRSATSFEEMISLDLEYLDHQSMTLDLRIMAKTLPAALDGRGAG